MVRETGRLAGEAWPFVFAGLCLGGLGLLLPVPGGILSLLGGAVVVTALVLFRDPYREVPALPRAVVSPVDGRVTEVSIREHADESQRVIRIRVARLGAWSFRSPVEGKVMGLPELQDRDGRALWLRTDEGDDVTTALIGPRWPAWLGPRARVAVGERLAQGQRFGTRRLAVEARLTLPLRSAARVEAGQRVRAGSDSLAELVHD